MLISEGTSIRKICFTHSRLERERERDGGEVWGGRECGTENRTSGELRASGSCQKLGTDMFLFVKTIAGTDQVTYSSLSAIFSLALF